MEDILCKKLSDMAEILRVKPSFNEDDLHVNFKLTTYR